MSLVARVLATLGLLSVVSTVSARNVNILVIGDSAAGNCNAALSGHVSGVYQLGVDGREKPAADPLDLADCKGGSIWVPLGEEMLRTGFAEKVVFVPVAVRGAKVHDWLPGGRANDRLSAAVKATGAEGLDFDYALWQDAESDPDLVGEQYLSDLNKVVKMVSLNARIKKWVIARGSHCDGTTGGAVEDMQQRFAVNPILNRFQGPHTSALGGMYREDGCIFNAQGQRKMAELWFDAIKKADINSDRYQKESLLYYFR